jgi:hypothetical protein
MKLRQFFSLPVFFSVILLGLNACKAPNPPIPKVIEFTGTDSSGKTADFIMAAIPSNAQSQKFIDLDILKGELSNDSDVQSKFPDQFAIAAVGIENCDGTPDDKSNANRVRLATEKKAKTIPFLPDYVANKQTDFNNFAGNFKKLEDLKTCRNNSPTSNQQRVIFIGVKRLSPNVSIVEAINDGLNKPKVDDLNLNDFSLYQIIYDPEKGNWTSFPIDGKDKDGKRVIFDFFVLTNEKAWFSGSDHEFTSFANQGKEPMGDLRTWIQGNPLLKTSLEVSDIWISFGVASCDGNQAKNENLATSRASKLQSDVLKTITVNRTIQPEYARVVLGQYNGKCDNNYIAMAEQRPVVIVIGTQASPDNPANVKEALYDALQTLEKSKTLLGKVKMSDFTITDPNKVIMIP